MPEFTFVMYFNAVAAFIIAELTALLPLRYSNQNPFLTVPVIMLVLVLSTVMYYLLQLGILLFPRSRFAAMAKHLTLFFAYAAVFSLVAALFPASRATAFIYTIFALFVAGHALFVFGIFAVEDEDHDNDDEDETWYEGFTNTCRRYKKKLARVVAGFFQDQTILPL